MRRKYDIKVKIYRTPFHTVPSNRHDAGRRNNEIVFSSVEIKSFGLPELFIFEIVAMIIQTLFQLLICKTVNSYKKVVKQLI